MRYGKTGCVSRRRALGRGGSERRWGASGWESDRVDALRLAIPCDRRVAANGRGQVEPHVRRRYEWRRGRAPMAELGTEKALAERDRLDLRLRPCTAIPDSRACIGTRDAQQRKLQGGRGEPCQEEVARQQFHGP